MKLTAATLKKIIREEIEKLSEAIPATFIKKGVINYNNDKIMYYIFDKGSYDSEDVEGLSQSPRLGHYRVNDKKVGQQITGALYLKIDQIVQNDPQLNGSYDYVVGITEEDVYQKLLQNKDILEDEQKK